jgi:hypothetical protein
VDEVAAVAEEAAAVVEEAPAGLGLVLAVLLLVLLEFVQPVRELAALLVGTAAVLDEPLAQLRLLLVERLHASGRLLRGQRVRGLFEQEQLGRGGRGGEGAA